MIGRQQASQMQTPCKGSEAALTGPKTSAPGFIEGRLSQSFSVYLLDFIGGCCYPGPMLARTGFGVVCAIALPSRESCDGLKARHVNR